MSTDSHSTQELARYRKALRAIADLESLPIGDQGEEMGSRLMAARLASAALAGEDGAEQQRSAVNLPTIGNRLAEAIDAELARARSLFPAPNKNFAALVEEVGELAQALLKDQPDNVRAEAIQVAVMAIRVHSEGDPTLTEPSK